MIQLLRDKKVIFFDVGYTLDRPASGDWLFTRLFLASPRVRRSWKIASVIFTLAVFASVLLLKQHYVADVPAGIATAELGMLWSRLFFDKKEPTE